jgi:hypothetical protein
MMKVEDAAGQMVACAVAYDIFMGSISAPEYVIKAAIISILLHECTGQEHHHPLYPYMVAALKPYPVSFFNNKPNASAIVDTFKNYFDAFNTLTKEHLNVSACLD